MDEDDYIEGDGSHKWVGVLLCLLSAAITIVSLMYLYLLIRG